MRYIYGSGLCVIGAFGTMVLAPKQSVWELLVGTFILASTMLMFVGTLKLKVPPER